MSDAQRVQHHAKILRRRQPLAVLSVMDAFAEQPVPWRLLIKSCPLVTTRQISSQEPPYLGSHSLS